MVSKTSPRLLIIEDNEEVLRSLKKYFTKKNYDVVTASNGLDGLKTYEGDPEGFDLIITDLYMPEMDGEQLSQYIRNESSQPAVPVLMVTSRKDHSRLAGIKQSGVSAVFDKPFGADTLRTVIEKVLA